MSGAYARPSTGKQAFSVLLGFCLALALLLSPYQLHSSPGSIFFIPERTEHTKHPSTQHEHQDSSKELRCLRCVLYGFQLPESVVPFTVVLVVLGFLKLAKISAPFSFITLSQNARAPPPS
jgi:hypothetical protein